MHIMRVVSTTKVESHSNCTTNCLMEDFVGSAVVQTAPRAMIERVNDIGKLLLADLIEVRALGQIAPEQTVGVFVGASLPSRVRIGEVNGVIGVTESLGSGLAFCPSHPTQHRYRFQALPLTPLRQPRCHRCRSAPTRDCARVQTTDNDNAKNK
jgi:hypothetical protein